MLVRVARSGDWAPSRKNRPRHAKTGGSAGRRCAGARPARRRRLRGGVVGLMGQRSPVTARSRPRRSKHRQPLEGRERQRCQGAAGAQARSASAGAAQPPKPQFWGIGPSFGAAQVDVTATPGRDVGIDHPLRCPIDDVQARPHCNTEPRLRQAALISGSGCFGWRPAKA